MTTNAVTRLMSVLTLIAFMINQQLVHAQNTIGITGQIGNSDIEVNGLGFLDIVDPYIKPITQYSAGISYEKEMSRHWSVVTGAQYTSRGFGMRENFNVDLFGLDLPIGARIDTRLQYVEVPIQLKYNFTSEGVTPYIKGGMSTAYAMSGKIQPKLEAIISWNLPEININLENDMYNRWDVSALVGAGVSIPTNDIGAVHFEVNYRHSLNDMFLDNITDIRIKSHGLSAGIGYTMRF